MIAAEAVLPIWAVLFIGAFGVVAPVLTLMGYFKTKDKVQEIHLLVNSKMSEALAENAQLRAQLKRADSSRGGGE